MTSNVRTKPAKSIRYRQSRLLQIPSACKYCGTIVNDGEDDCGLCTDAHGTLPISIQYAEGQAWQAEQISWETEEYWRQTCE